LIDTRRKLSVVARNSLLTISKINELN